MRELRSARAYSVRTAGRPDGNTHCRAAQHHQLVPLERIWAECEEAGFSEGDSCYPPGAFLRSSDLAERQSERPSPPSRTLSDTCRLRRQGHRGGKQPRQPAPPAPEDATFLINQANAAAYRSALRERPKNGPSWPFPDSTVCAVRIMLYRPELRGGGCQALVHRLRRGRGFNRPCGLLTRRSRAGGRSL